MPTTALPPPLLQELALDWQVPRSGLVYGPGTISFVGRAFDGANSATVNLTWPGGLAANDQALVLWTFQNTALPTTPTGFTLVTNNDGATGSMRTYLYRKTLAGTESGTLACTLDVSNRQSVCLVIYRGVDTTTPVDGTAVQTTGISGLTHTNPALAPTVANCVIVASIHERASSIDTGFAEPAGYLKRADTDHGLAWGSGGTVTTVADDGLAAGRDTSSVTPGVWTGDGTTANVVTYTLALRPLAGDTNAPAGTAAGQGDGFDANIALLVNAESAAATGVAFDSTAAISASAVDAAGTGVADNPNVALLVNAESASATVAAFDATVVTGTLAPAELATATGTANDATVALLVNAETTTGTGIADNPTPSVSAAAGTATATGVADNPAASVAVNAESAAATGVAFDATVVTGTLAPAELASATGTANDPTLAVRVNAECPTATAAAFDATVATGKFAPADFAAAAGTAFDAAVTIQVNAESATGTAAAFAATVTAGSFFVPAYVSVDGTLSGTTLDGRTTTPTGMDGAMSGTQFDNTTAAASTGLGGGTTASGAM